MTSLQPSAYVMTNTHFTDPYYGYRLAHMMADWVTRRGIDRAAARSWLMDLEESDSRLSYFFSVNRYLLLGTK